MGGTIMQVVLTLKNLLGSLINFCVPLIIIGFIAPSITRLRSNASRMLVLALALAYTSSVCAALMSMGAGYAIIPGLSIQSAAEGLREAPELLFNLDIAPVMSVMSALVFLCWWAWRPPGPGPRSSPRCWRSSSGWCWRWSLGW